MSSPRHTDDSSLVKAYNQMMIRVRQSIDDAESNAVPSLQKAIDQAKKQAIHLGEISLEEAEEVSNYIKRDINDAAEYLMETSQEFSEWLLLDIDIIEQKVLELFLSVADRTRVELAQFSHPGCDISDQTTDASYHAGEITGPKHLQCVKCGREIRLNQTQTIPCCPGCQCRHFKRAGTH